MYRTVSPSTVLATEKFKNTDTEIPEAQNHMKFSALVKYVCLFHEVISQQNW